MERHGEQARAAYRERGFDADVGRCVAPDSWAQGTRAEYGDEPIPPPSSSPSRHSNRTSAAIGGSMRFDDEIAVAGGDLTGALYSEETGLALKPLQQPRKAPCVAALSYVRSPTGALLTMCSCGCTLQSMLSVAVWPRDDVLHYRHATVACRHGVLWYAPGAPQRAGCCEAHVTLAMSGDLHRPHRCSVLLVAGVLHERADHSQHSRYVRDVCCVLPTTQSHPDCLCQRSRWTPGLVVELVRLLMDTDHEAMKGVSVDHLMMFA